jgi:3-phenylpropionate/cinnamic acid dioxygenase small subunit
MTDKTALQVEVERFIFDEAALVDQCRWQEWLEMYTEDMVYWAPSWVNEREMTTDPEGEVSIIYMNSRKELEHRIWRFTSGESPASYPLPRTNHIISNVRILEDRRDSVVVASNWLTQCYRNKEQFLYGGFYEHTLIRSDSGLKISQKKVVLLNDVVLGYVDVYHL